MESTLNPTSDRVTAAKNTGGDTLSNGVKSLKDSVSSTAETIGTSGKALGRQAMQLASGADEFVRVRPWHAVGVAALIGVAIGYLSGRRS